MGLILAKILPSAPAEISSNLEIFFFKWIGNLKFLEEGWQNVPFAWVLWPQLRKLFPLSLSAGGHHVLTTEFYLQIGTNIWLVIMNVLYLQQRVYKSVGHLLIKELNLPTLQPGKSHQPCSPRHLCFGKVGDYLDSSHWQSCPGHILEHAPVLPRFLVRDFSTQFISLFI